MDIQTREIDRSKAGGADVSITVGVDGRLYCHDIAPELIGILTAICGDDAELVLRHTPCASQESNTP
jgi:hypothetical protein